MIKKLFISHSSRPRENKALLQQVCNGLGSDGAGYKILVDQGGGIYAGDDWDLRLNEWMAECHAAVILFSEAALRESDWVKKEAAILAWRRAVEDDFPLIPVLLDNLQPDDLQEGFFDVVRMDNIQCIRCGADADGIVQQTLARLGEARFAPATPFERLERVVRDLLTENAGLEALADAWEALPSVQRPNWDHQQPRRFAAALTRFLVRDRLQALGHLRELLNRIRPKVRRERCNELLEYMRALWVDPRAAAGLTAAFSDQRAVALNGALLPDFTAERYGERAWPLDSGWKPVHIDASRYDAAGIIETVHAAFDRTNRLSAKIVKQKMDGLGKPILVILPPPEQVGVLPDDDLLQDVLDYHENLVLMVNTGANLPHPFYSRARPLLPALDTEIESKQYAAYLLAQEFIDEQLHGTSS